MLLHRRGDVHDFFAVGPVDLDVGGRLALVPDDQVDILETVMDFGDVAETHDCTVIAAEDDDFLEVLLVIALTEGADTYLGLLGFDATGG